MRRGAYYRRMTTRLLVALVVIGLAITFYNASSDDMDPSLFGAEEVDGQNVDPVEPLIPAYYAKSALTLALNRHYSTLPEGNVRSFSLSGKYLSGEVTYDFESYSKRGKLYRQSFRSKSGEFSASSVGGNYWETLDDVKVERALLGIERLNPMILALETDYYALPWAYREGGLDSLVLLRKVVGEDGSLYDVVENKHILPVSTLHYLDHESGLELKREAKVFLDGVEHLISIKYEYGAIEELDGELVGVGPVLALKRYYVKIDGEVFSTATIESYRANLGMPDWFFQK